MSRFKSLLVVGLSSVLCQCGPDSEATVPQPAPQSVPESQDIEIQFDARVLDARVGCGQALSGLGPDGDQSVEFEDFRFYVHGFELIRQDGTAVPVELFDEQPWQTREVALLDFENKTGRCINGTPETRTVVRGKVKGGEYKGLRFVLGVPFALNHGDLSNATYPLNLSALYWNWQGGYKFARWDAVTRQPGKSDGYFAFHLASTGCDGTPVGGVTQCTAPNRATIELSNFDITKDMVVFNYGHMVAGMDMFRRTAQSSPGCMAGPTDPDCADTFPRLGIGHSGRAPAQEVFSVEPRP